MRASALALLVACTVVGCGPEEDEPAPTGNTEPPVAYSGPDGPEHWGDLHEDWRACGEGRRQSPVDLEGAAAGDGGALAFDYSPAGVAAADTGRSIGFTPVANDALRIGGRPVGTLKQLHFHAPSEHRAFAMEFHLVHTTEDDRTAVVGVLVEEGAPNPAIEALSQDLPDGGEPPVVGELDPRALLPADTSSIRYPGSLTTPPCTEGVDWVVLQRPITLSPAQVARFRDHYDGNNRPLQPLGDRPLVAVE
jgi:carbonic anhydrase